MCLFRAEGTSRVYKLVILFRIDSNGHAGRISAIARENAEGPPYVLHFPLILREHEITSSTDLTSAKVVDRTEEVRNGRN